jgi:hypothetical protein
MRTVLCLSRSVHCPDIIPRIMLCSRSMPCTVICPVHRLFALLPCATCQLPAVVTCLAQAAGWSILIQVELNLESPSYVCITTHQYRQNRCFPCSMHTPVCFCTVKNRKIRFSDYGPCPGGAVFCCGHLQAPTMVVVGLHVTYMLHWTVARNYVG